MVLLLEILVICIMFFIFCYAGTGSDEKNIKSYASYPDEIQKMLKNEPAMNEKIKTVSNASAFISNLILFSIILFLFGLVIRNDSFFINFINILIMGEVLNLFDLIIIDLVWWRHSKRIRFSILDVGANAYLDPGKHIAAFGRGALMFAAVALVDGILLTLLSTII